MQAAFAVQDAVLCIPLDRRLPKTRLRSRELHRLAGQRFIVRLGDWPAASRFPSCYLIRVLGPINDQR